MKTASPRSSHIFFALIVGALAYSSFAHADNGHQHSASDAAAAGTPGKASAVTRTINIEMADNMRFNPANVTVKQGETIRFVVLNNGKLKHEMVIGSTAELVKHAELMRQMPGMKHKETNQISVEPGKTGELIWKLSKATTVDFACLEPGHFEAGMKGQVSVSTGK